jgi:hypothetical protein
MQQLAEDCKSRLSYLGLQHPEILKRKNELREAVAAAFAERQERHRSELADFRRRLAEIEKQIEDRERTKDEIVQRRVEELIRPHRDAIGLIEATLDRKANVESYRQARTLSELADALAKQLGVLVLIDHRSLDEIGFDPDSDVRVSERLDSATYRGVLRQTLTQYGLDFILPDRYVMITSLETAERRLDTRVVSIAHLATPTKDLIQAILSTISPQSWDELGGPGSIRVLVEGQRLAIRQTQRVHEQVAELLKLMGFGATTSRTGPRDVSELVMPVPEDVQKEMGPLGGMGPDAATKGQKPTD